MLNIRDFVDVRNASQSRRIFGDPEIYQMELERIFERCWLFLTHESLVPKVGDFITTTMGEDEVIVWRQRDGSVKAFLNVCKHRGMKLCMAEAGNSRGMSCAYHGWAYGIDGNLENVPVGDEEYGPEFRRHNGLREVPLVESYRGFIFGCLDAEAPTLKNFLGDAAFYFDLWADVPGGVELVGPPSRSILTANWKSPTENFIGDAGHIYWTHASAMMGMFGRPSTPHSDAKGMGIQSTSRYGHGLAAGWGLGGGMLAANCPEIMAWPARRKAQVEAEKGPRVSRLVDGHWDASIFPNCSYLVGTRVFKVWHPRGPDKVEIMTWAIVDKEMPADLKQRLKTATQRVFGPAGMLEADDLDNLEYVTRPNRGSATRKERMNLQMGMGKEYEDPDYPGVIGNLISETAQRGFYRFYADCLSTSNWEELESVTATWKEDILRRS